MEVSRKPIALMSHPRACSTAFERVSTLVYLSRKSDDRLLNTLLIILFFLRF